jgi:hypothetical protein
MDVTDTVKDEVMRRINAVNDKRGRAPYSHNLLSGRPGVIVEALIRLTAEHQELQARLATMQAYQRDAIERSQ